MASLIQFARRGVLLSCRSHSRLTSVSQNQRSTSKVSPMIQVSGCRYFKFTSNRSFASDVDDNDDKRESWFRRLIPIRRIDPGKESHSRMLSDKDMVYELQIHSVKPEYMESYLNEYNEFTNLVHAKDTGAKLAGSWTVEIGDQDEAVHLWKYPGGYPVLNRATGIYRTDKEFVDFRTRRNKMLRSRRNQILLAFSFWGDIAEKREGKNIYEMRSYVLKPGTMIEWGNNWAKGIKSRQDREEAVAGLFSHIGELYVVHHIWGYESLQDRKEIREAAWRRPGWDECVAYTVPLIRTMTARILIPTPFSPLQ